MFAPSYFAARYFGAEYFAEAGGTPLWPTVLKDLTTMLCKYIPTLLTENLDVTTALSKHIVVWRNADPGTGPSLDTNTVMARALS